MPPFELRYSDWSPGEYPRERLKTYATLEEAKAAAAALRLDRFDIWEYRDKNDRHRPGWWNVYANHAY